MLDFWLSFQSASAELAALFLHKIHLPLGLKLLLCSAVLGAVFVYLYSFISFQNSLSGLKKKITAAAIEPFLFRDSLALSISSPIKLFFLGLKYLTISLPPLFILALPMVWILGFLNQSFGYRDLEPGDRIFVTILADNAKAIRGLELKAELTGMELSETVKAPFLGQAYAELRVTTAAASGHLNLIFGTENVKLPIGLAPAAIPILTKVYWEKLLFPGAKLRLPPGFSQVSLALPDRSYQLFDISLHWIIIFFVVSLVSGLLFARYSGIEV
jgi:hypothetical protein